VLCNDQVFETFRSLYALRPAQSSVMRRRTGFNVEAAAEQAHIDRTKANYGLNLLVQDGNVEYFPGRSVQILIKAPSTDPGHLNNSSWEKSPSSILLLTLLSTLFSSPGSAFS
jgi:hypothetical protein